MKQELEASLRRYGSIAEWSSKLPTVPIHKISAHSEPGISSHQPIFDCYIGLNCGIALVSIASDKGMRPSSLLIRENATGGHRSFSIIISTSTSINTSSVNRALDRIAELSQTHGADWKGAKVGSRIALSPGSDLLAP